MIHDVDAIYDHGVFRLSATLPLRDGARVRLRVEEEDRQPAGTAKADYEAWLDGMAGRWEGEFVRGDEGEFESRESLP